MTLFPVMSRMYDLLKRHVITAWEGIRVQVQFPVSAHLLLRFYLPVLII